MKNLEKRIFTVLFLAGLGLYSVFSMMESKSKISDFLASAKISDADGIKNAIIELDDIFKENIAVRYETIEAYGLVNKLLGKNEINGFEYVRDKNGFLSLGNFWNEVYDIDEKALALNTEHFYEKLKKKNIEMLFVSYPQKVSEKWTDGYAGIPYDDYSYEARMFMTQIRKYRIPYLDLNKTLLESEEPYEKLFYKTDHHWTSKGAFIGFKELVNKVEELGFDIDSDEYYTNLDNYEKILYKNMMLGSAGRSVGLNYAGGAEDFELYYLKDDTQYSYKIGDNIMQGSIEDTLIDFHIPQSIEDYRPNIYIRSMYDMYMRGIDQEMGIEIKNNIDGPNILMITDSYSSPIATWLAPMCNKIDFIWAKYNSAEKIEKMINDNDYDLVIMALYPNDMNSDFIHFIN